MSDLLHFTAVQARKALEAGDFTAVELTSAYLAAAKLTTSLNNYVAQPKNRLLAWRKKVMRPIKTEQRAH